MSVPNATIATVDSDGVTLLLDEEEDMHYLSLVSLLRKGK